MLTNLETLNRLRVNAGKPELKSWKASGKKLEEAIQGLVAGGFTDALPGANVNAEPKTDDPEVAKVIQDPVPETKPKKAKKSEPVVEEKPEPKVTNGEAKLGRGLENEPMARQSRLAIQMRKERERREGKAAKKEEKAAAKAAKKEALPKGAVDPKKDPEKAARQQKHIEEKKKARAAKPKVEENSNEISVADIARELDIDPKVARAKLRRHEDKIKKLHTKGQDRWTFPKSAKAELVKILK
jgi:hypothetical protein